MDSTQAIQTVRGKLNSQRIHHEKMTTHSGLSGDLHAFHHGAAEALRLAIAEIDPIIGFDEEEAPASSKR